MHAPAGRVAGINLIALVGALAALLTAGGVGAQIKRPAGSVVIEGRGAAIIVDGGRLIFRGREYTFAIRGLSATPSDLTGVRARGEVYDLKDVADFSGRYRALQSDEPRENRAVTLVNEARVRLRLVPVSQTARIELSGDEIDIAVDQ